MNRPRSFLMTAAAALLTLALPAHAAFTNNGDGTVTDSTTGLMWDRCAIGFTDKDCTVGSATARSWEAALAAVDTANADTHRGHSDWRLPNRTELESLIDITQANTATSSNFSAAFPNTPQTRFWSSTTDAYDNDNAWPIYFVDGNSYEALKTTPLNARLVRGGPSSAAFDAARPPTPATVTSIPTLGEWSLLLLGVLIATLGMRSVRRG